MIPHLKFRIGLVRAVVSLGAMLPPMTCHAYCDDVHYWFTYFAARTVGYTDEQAYRIALADVSVDEANSPTNPIPDWTHPNVFMQADARNFFHAFLDDRSSEKWYINTYSVSIGNKTAHISISELNRAAPTNAYRKWQANIIKRQSELQSWTKKNGNNCGVLLHFVQDRFSHAGYGVTFAQAVNKFGVLPSSDILLPGGTLTDFVSFDQLNWGRAIGVNYAPWIWYRGDRNVLMVRETLRILEQMKPMNLQGLPDADARCLQLLRRMQANSVCSSYFNDGIEAARNPNTSMPYLGPEPIDTSYAEELIDEELGKAGMVRMAGSRDQAYRYKYASFDQNGNLKVVAQYPGEIPKFSQKPVPEPLVPIEDKPDYSYRSNTDMFSIVGQIAVGMRIPNGNSSSNGGSNGQGGTPGDVEGGTPGDIVGGIPGEFVRSMTGGISIAGSGKLVKDGSGIFTGKQAGGKDGVFSGSGSSKNGVFSGGSGANGSGLFSGAANHRDRAVTESAASRGAGPGTQGNNSASKLPTAYRLLAYSDTSVEMVNGRFIYSPLGSTMPKIKPRVVWSSEFKSVSTMSSIVSPNEKLYQATFTNVPMTFFLFVEAQYSDGSTGICTLAPLSHEKFKSLALMMEDVYQSIGRTTNSPAMRKQQAQGMGKRKIRPK